MRPLRHGYTNNTGLDGRVVVKRYAGPDATRRRQREEAALRALAGRVPVAPLLDGSDDGAVHLGLVAGVQGQELIDSGHAAAVLNSCGDVLRKIHAIDVAMVLPDLVAAESAATAPAVAGSAMAGPAVGAADVGAADAGAADVTGRPGAVLVHGDFGPNNVLLDPRTYLVTVVLDWEWARTGRPAEDLAWCEWIVRMHHEAHVDALGEFFDAYGHRPTWAERQDAMLAQCRRLLDFCERWDAGSDATRLWRHRLDATAGWTE